MAGARGEGYVEVDGEQRPVLFTNRALAEIERATGKPITTLISQGSLTVNDMAQALATGLEHGRRDAKEARRSYTINDAFAVMDAMGFTAVTKVVVTAIAEVLSYSGERTDSPPA